jgi:hypothetical protein
MQGNSETARKAVEISRGMKKFLSQRIDGHLREISASLPERNRKHFSKAFLEGYATPA